MKYLKQVTAAVHSGRMPSILCFKGRPTVHPVVQNRETRDQG